MFWLVLQALNDTVMGSGVLYLEWAIRLESSTTCLEV